MSSFQKLHIILRAVDVFFPDLTPNHSPSTLPTGEWIPDTVPSFYVWAITI